MQHVRGGEGRGGEGREETSLSLFVISHTSGPNRGHYITIVKSHGYWILFDDDIVEVSPYF